KSGDEPAAIRLAAIDELVGLRRSVAPEFVDLAQQRRVPVGVLAQLPASPMADAPGDAEARKEPRQQARENDDKDWHCPRPKPEVDLRGGEIRHSEQDSRRGQDRKGDPPSQPLHRHLPAGRRGRDERAADSGLDRILAIGLLAVEPISELLARLEEGDGLLRNRNGRAGARIAAQPCVPVLDGKSAKAAQFHAVAAGKSRRDLVEDCADDALDIAMVQVRIQLPNAQDQLRLGHDGQSPERPRIVSHITPRCQTWLPASRITLSNITVFWGATGKSLSSGSRSRPRKFRIWPLRRLPHPYPWPPACLWPRRPPLLFSAPWIGQRQECRPGWRR